MTTASADDRDQVLATLESWLEDGENIWLGGFEHEESAIRFVNSFDADADCICLVNFTRHTDHPTIGEGRPWVLRIKTRSPEYALAWCFYEDA
jgi:hypothetical protein